MRAALRKLRMRMISQWQYCVCRKAQRNRARVGGSWRRTVSALAEHRGHIGAVVTDHGNVHELNAAAVADTADAAMLLMAPGCKLLHRRFQYESVMRTIRDTVTHSIVQLADCG